MKLRKQQVARVAVGAVLVLVSAVFTMFIRDTLSMREPENALPVMDVYYNGLEAGDLLPADHIRRDKYEWKFTFGSQVSGGGKDLEVWREIVPGWVAPGSDIDLEFTFPAKEVKVYMAAGESEFVEMTGDLYAPQNPTVYTFRVEASWGPMRNVTYFFRIRVPDWNQ